MGCCCSKKLKDVQIYSAICDMYSARRNTFGKRFRRTVSQRAESGGNFDEDINRIELTTQPPIKVLDTDDRSPIVTSGK